MENKDVFVGLWKNVQLQERISKDLPQGRADDLRNVLVQIQTARTNKTLDNISCNELFLKEADKYAELVDSPDEQGGLNNYAESVLSCLQGKRNESAQWKSSLCLINVANMDCIKRYKDICKASKSTVIPVDKEHTTIPFTKELTVSDLNTFPSGKDTFSSIPQHSTFQQSTSGEQRNVALPHQHTNVVKGFVPAQSILQSTGNYKANSSKVSDKIQSHGLFSKHHHSIENSDNDRNNFWNVGTDSNSTGQYRENNIFQGTSSFSADDFGSSKYKELSNKRGRDMDEEENISNAPALGAPMFRTARQQLAIDNQKKYGNKSKPQGSVNNAAYGTAKKSLGTRRGLNSKFVPPVMNREDDESDCGTLVQRAGPHKGSKIETGNGEEVDERLKNIEPKMVELIMSEIMDQGKLLTWNDIAGLEFAKKTIQEIVVWPMLRPDIFTGLRGPPKGLLLFGPPGTGKTLIGKCIASQSRSTFFSISASSLTSKWVGEGEKMVRALFAVARVHQPAVVFIDEIDSLLSQRSDTEHESSRRIKTEFLVQLDGATTGETDRILVIGATNRPQEIDEAARRRFVKRLYIPLPEAAARKHIVHNLMTEQSHHLEQNELETILEKSDGYSGADMANLCREAALGPIRSIPMSDIQNITADQVRPILYEDFEQALKQVRASVSEKDLDLYLDWNKQYGSWGM